MKRGSQTILIVASVLIASGLVICAIKRSKNGKIKCNNCGWKWNIKDGGNDLYSCHKCNYDNTPKANDHIEPYHYHSPYFIT